MKRFGWAAAALMIGAAGGCGGRTAPAGQAPPAASATPGVSVAAAEAAPAQSQPAETKTASAPAEKIQWASSFDAAMAEAKKSDKLIVADFYTDWCGYCKKLDKETWPDSRVAAASGDFVPVKIHAEKEGAKLTRQYQVRGFPALLFIDKSGNEVTRIGGFLPAEPFAQALKDISGKHREFLTLEAQVRQNSGDNEAAVRLAQAYGERGDAEHGSPLLEQAAKAVPEHPNLPAATNAVAAAYIRQGKPDAAIPLLRRSLAIAKSGEDVAAAHFNLAGSYLMLEQLKEAAGEFEAVLAVRDAPQGMRERVEGILPQVREMLKKKQKQGGDGTS